MTKLAAVVLLGIASAASAAEPPEPRWRIDTGG